MAITLADFKGAKRGDRVFPDSGDDAYTVKSRFDSPVNGPMLLVTEEDGTPKHLAWPSGSSGIVFVGFGGYTLATRLNTRGATIMPK